jgi:hypothetical protein
MTIAETESVAEPGSTLMGLAARSEFFRPAGIARIG